MTDSDAFAAVDRAERVRRIRSRVYFRLATIGVVWLLVVLWVLVRG